MFSDGELPIDISLSIFCVKTIPVEKWGPSSSFLPDVRLVKVITEELCIEWIILSQGLFERRQDISVLEKAIEGGILLGRHTK
ncbi:hypothetical protein AHF37_10738 [Paragonimus kellicotti]|nr:hypothetical protein AHF37_10738 [Paragonimus kellicotti]